MIRIFIGFLLCFTFSLASEEPLPKKPIATSGYYIVTYKNYDVNMELSVNGYVIKDGASNEDSSGQADINYWIMPGKNIISVRLSERKQKKKSEIEFSPKASYDLVIGQAGQFPDEGEKFLNFEWPKDNNTTPSKEWIHLEFVPPFIPPSKLWEKAEKIELTANAKEAAMKFSEELTKALNTKDPKKIEPLIHFRTKDTSESRYYPMNAESERKELKNMIKAIGSSWKLNKKDVVYSLLCDNKILNISDKKGNSILKGKNGAEIPLYLSLVEGKWIISR